jgi:hypothetical protein
MIPSLLSEEFQAAQQLAHNADADPRHRLIADGALARMQHPDDAMPVGVNIDWRRGYIDPSLPMRIGR